MTTDSVCILLQNASISTYANTGSMIPTLNQDTNGIEITPERLEDIHLGDLITYQKDKDKDHQTKINSKPKKPSCSWMKLFLHLIR